MTVRDGFRQLVGRLSDPRGGTEIGQAIRGTIEGTRARDLLLITDGKSYALDVQGLAQVRRRISVLLVGEDNRPFFGQLSSNDFLLGNPTVCVQGDRATHLVFPVRR